MIFKKLIGKIHHHSHSHHNGNDTHESSNQASSSSSECEPTSSVAATNHHETPTFSLTHSNRNASCPLIHEPFQQQHRPTRTRPSTTSNDSCKLHKIATGSLIYNEAENDNHNNYCASSTSSYSDNPKVELKFLNNFASISNIK